MDTVLVYAIFLQILICPILYMHGIKYFVNSFSEFGIFKRFIVNSNTILRVPKQGQMGSLRRHIDAIEELQASFP